MLTQTEAIVLNYTKYSDSSVIVHTLTNHFGRQSLIIHGIGKSKHSKLAFFQPLFLLDIHFYFKPGKIQRIKEYRLPIPLHKLSNDVYKKTIALFISEVLYRCVKEEFADKELFGFIKTSILILDEIKTGIPLFHIAFMVKLARRLGFMADEKIQKDFFDFKEGHEIAIKPPHNFYIRKDEHNLLIELLDIPYINLEKISVTLVQRNNLLDAVVLIYEQQLLNFKAIKSYQVLKEVFSE